MGRKVAFNKPQLLPAALARGLAGFLSPAAFYFGKRRRASSGAKAEASERGARETRLSSDGRRAVLQNSRRVRRPQAA